MTAESGGWFIKQDAFPEDAVAKYNWLHEVGESGNFRAPRAKLVRTENGLQVALEFVPDFVSLRELYIRHLLRRLTTPDFLSIMRDVGSALASVHSSPVPGNWTLHPMESAIEAEAKRFGLRQVGPVANVPLHGDFGQLNVGISKDSETVVILDPCANTDTVVRGHLVYGDPNIDVGLMLGFLEGQVRSPAIIFATQRRVSEAQLAFLSGYCAKGRSVDLESAFAYSSAFYSFRMRPLGLLRRLSTRMLYNRFRANSTAQAKVAYLERSGHV
jgi:hypothetical protein